MNEMAESLNIINQVVYKIIKHKELKTNKKKINKYNKYTNISPHNILKYLNASE
jgi:NADH:ubiquinone oxidoreductase subunit D